MGLVDYSAARMTNGDIEALLVASKTRENVSLRTSERQCGTSSVSLDLSGSGRNVQPEAKCLQLTSS